MTYIGGDVEQGRIWVIDQWRYFSDTVVFYPTYFPVYLLSVLNFTEWVDLRFVGRTELQDMVTNSTEESSVEGELDAIARLYVLSRGA